MCIRDSLANGGTLVSIHSTDHTTGLSPVRVQVGIDAAVVANHHVCVREILPDGQVRLTRFTTPPTLAGLDMLSARLSNYPGAVSYTHLDVYKRQDRRATGPRWPRSR